MAYLGRGLDRGNYLKLDDISSQFNGSTTTFNLTSGGQPFYPGSAFSILVSLGGVIQEPESAYQINQNQIIFASAPQVSDDFFCVPLGLPLAINVPGDGTVTGDKLSKPFNYDTGLLYLDDANNRVGINSTSPRVALDLRGDFMTSGISTFTGGVSISGNLDSVGIVTARSDLIVGAGLSVVGVLTARSDLIVGAGLSVVGVLTARSDLIVGAGLSVVGVITATGGFNIGIQSGGVNVTTGVVTALNFIGVGNTFTYDSATKTVNISIQGGGGVGAGGTWNANNVGVYTGKIVGVNTTNITGAANSEGALQAFGNVAVIDGALLTDQNIDSSVFIPSGRNGLLIGPVTVGIGITIDIATGSVLVIV